MVKTSKDRGLRFGEGSVLVRGETKVQARWPDGGRMRAKTFTAATVGEARDLAEDHLRKIARDKRSGRYVPPSELTVEGLMAEYLERGKQRWSTNTQASYALLVRRWIIPGIGMQRVVELTTRYLQTWFDGLVRDGQQPSQVNNIRIILSGAFREAVRLGTLATNPVTGIRTPTRRKTVLSTWSAPDVRAVLAACAGDVWMHTFYTVALTTGMRPGELRALMWKDIDLEAGRIQCRRSMTRDASFRAMVGDQTKSGRTRVIAIPGETVIALKSVQQDQRTRRIAHADWQATDIVFDRGSGTFIALTTLETRHRAICAAAKVQHIRLHDLRHTAATLLLEADVHPKVVSDILGHSSIAITMDRYAHVSDALQRAATSRLGDVLRGETKRQNPA